MAWDEKYKTGNGSVITPRGAGKLKSLWDAVRTAGDPGPAPDAAPVVIAQAAPPKLPSPDQVGDQADPNMAPPTLDSIPGNKRVGDLQSQVDQSNRKATIKDRLMRAAPVIAAAGLGAAFNAPALVRGAEEGQEAAAGERQLRRKSLTDQLEAAQRERATEYDAAQRNQQATNVANEGRRGRQLTAQILADSRRDVAGTNADARTTSATTMADSRRDVASTGGNARLGAAQIGADARVVAGRYAADAAANRQSRSIAASLDRQGRSFEHQDEKPTAAEDQRADYLNGLKENLDVLRDIAKRRGKDFMGKLQGRVSQGRLALGTDDPDLATWEQAQHNLGILATSAHGMRAYKANSLAANSVTNGLKNSPEAFLKAADSLEASARSMGETYSRPTLRSRVAPAPVAAPAKGPAQTGDSGADLVYDTATGTLKPAKKGR